MGKLFKNDTCILTIASYIHLVYGMPSYGLEVVFGIGNFISSIIITTTKQTKYL